MCLYPRLIKNPKYKPNKKNAGDVPIPTDPRVMATPIGCGQCMECMKKKSREWKVRLCEDIKTNKEATFVTLTFNNESLNKFYADKKINNLKGYQLDNATAKLATRLFLERWRKNTGKSVKHWLITELGHQGTERIHLHGLLWSKDNNFIKNTWNYGYVYTGIYVNERTINYISKYITKQDLIHKTYIPIILCSKGIGSNYINTKQAEYNKYKKETNETYLNRNGTKTALPIYYRNKIYTEKQREELWIEKLNKQERYINGTKIDVSTEKGQKTYTKLLKLAQLKNRKLGYAKGQEKWKLANYEAERKYLLQKKISKTNDQK